MEIKLTWGQRWAALLTGKLTLDTYEDDIDADLIEVDFEEIENRIAAAHKRVEDLELAHVEAAATSEPKPGVANIENRGGVTVLSGRMAYPEPVPKSRKQRRQEAFQEARQAAKRR